MADLTSKTTAELRAMVDDINNQRDVLKVRVRELVAEIDTRAEEERVAQRLARMSSREKRILAQKLFPTGIPSTEEFGKLGG